jgi:hypothetical protein
MQRKSPTILFFRVGTLSIFSSSIDFAVVWRQSIPTCTGLWTIFKMHFTLFNTLILAICSFGILAAAQRSVLSAPSNGGVTMKQIRNPRWRRHRTNLTEVYVDGLRKHHMPIPKLNATVTPRMRRAASSTVSGYIDGTSAGQYAPPISKFYTLLPTYIFSQICHPRLSRHASQATQRSIRHRLRSNLVPLRSRTSKPISRPLNLQHISVRFGQCLQRANFQHQLCCWIYVREHVYRCLLCWHARYCRRACGSSSWCRYFHFLYHFNGWDICVESQPNGC